ncbi:MAG TPA: UDP-3-O-(3-hydroxymyristoyl)glucosamine N-acyltransferase [bacterium]|nr:UDP-3-O-(3-hydroxymyristoyl)glucosamine N-acyltransferase [Candidatus Omnitrophota bacterium]HOJ58665.1 UDP-3-O-(3-hydroxymyristoyl)glucosamine N-acyltransferase [bacterium]HOL95278.1 UDP-3-O-(3-hydroxymyristoyl)glucosamine N-acyltransferase [bacterium]HPP00286.1 UDP-3-O-(3-hydroxymyristoyl)glucosamine N-acyltransferase [bacterium]HXK92422.1 UDP-3-O-(3-hydroxymyristoyl)glucosamine N-acyltransferase [bacterium]
MLTYTLKELCDRLGESFEGDGSILLSGVAEITAAQAGELSFVANPKYVAKIPECHASVLIVPKDLETTFRPVIRSSNPYLTFSKALYLFHKDQRKTAGGVHPTSHVAASAQLGRDVTIMANVVVAGGARIGDRCVLYPGVFVGEGAVLGEEVTLYPHVSIYPRCRLGDRVILHAGCRIGPMDADPRGEGPAPVVLDPDVELGANGVVSGLPQAPTHIGEGTKADNLVQISAGAQIGPHCIIVAQVTIGEHATLEERVTIAGQVVVAPGVRIGALARIGAKSFVTSDVPPDADYWGIPAQPATQEKRMKANVARLPKLFEKIRSMEERLPESDPEK